MVAKVLTHMLLCSFLIATYFGHLQAQEQSQSYRKENAVAGKVRINVRVAEKKSENFLAGLKKEDLSIYEDGSKQAITRFTQNGGPISVVLLVDSSGSMRPIIGQIVEGLSQGLLRLRPEDEIALMSFNQEPRLLQDFTKNKQLLADTLRTIVPQKPTLLKEALYQAAGQLRKARDADNRKMIVVVTDNVSTTSEGARSKREIIEQIHASTAVICGLIVPNPLREQLRGRYPEIQSIPTPKQDGDIRTYAEETGGIAKLVGKNVENEIATTFFEIAGALRDYYSIEYVSSNPKQDGKYRKLRLKPSQDVEKREGKIITTQGYYAPDIKSIDRPRP